MAHIILNRPVNKFKIQETIRLIWTALIIKETKLSDVTVVATQFKKKKAQLVTAISLTGYVSSCGKQNICFHAMNKVRCLVF